MHVGKEALRFLLSERGVWFIEEKDARIMDQGASNLRQLAGDQRTGIQWCTREGGQPQVAEHPCLGLLCAWSRQAPTLTANQQIFDHGHGRKELGLLMHD